MITAMPRIAVATRDFDTTLRHYRDTLGMPVVDLSPGSVQSLGARLAMCVADGGSNIELMAPADPAAPLARSLARFLDRRGDGLFALMLEAPDPDAEAELLAERGLDVMPLMAGAAGRDVHPRSTHGVLIRVYPTASFRADREAIRSDPARALGLSGIVRVVIAVTDLAHAANVYGHGFGIESLGQRLDEARGVHTAACRPPTGGVIELVSVSDARRPFASAIARHMAARGEGLFAIVLHATDPMAVRAALLNRGLRAEWLAHDADRIEIDPCAPFHARILIEPSAPAGNDTAGRPGADAGTRS